MEATIPNSGSKLPKNPLEVLVQHPDRPTSWTLGWMREWRWVDQAAGTWEARITVTGRKEAWIDGSRLRRVGTTKP